MKRTPRHQSDGLSMPRTLSYIVLWMVVLRYVQCVIYSMCRSHSQSSRWLLMPNHCRQPSNDVRRQCDLYMIYILAWTNCKTYSRFESDLRRHGANMTVMNHTMFNRHPNKDSLKHTEVRTKCAAFCRRCIPHWVRIFLGKSYNKNRRGLLIRISLTMS